MARPSTIAIDGPVAAGKTSVGRSVSKKLRYRLLDTGIMYRAITWLALHNGIDVEDEAALGNLARATAVRLKEGDDSAVLLDGHAVSKELRGPEVDRAVSLVARVAAVREALVEQQREIAREGRIVVVGRDIGTVVLPCAELKLYLVASVAERARRRHLELVRQGHPVEYSFVLDNLRERDNLDTGRANSPLRSAPDAVLVDTDGIDMDEVVERMLELIGND